MISALELVLPFLIRRWELFSLPVRFVLTFWALLAFMYYSIDQYERLNYLRRKRTVEYHNWPILRIFPVTISACVAYQFVMSGGLQRPLLPSGSAGETILVGVGFALVAWGLAFALAGRVALNGHWGTKIYNYANQDDQRFITSGIYGVMRHPIYFGQFIMSFGTFFVSNDWWFVIFPLAVAVMNTLRGISETRSLRNAYGEPFERYCKTTMPIQLVLLPLGSKIGERKDADGD
jgi:protein-S-isoprenylcysteine O-methyltransferase Ste14